MPSDASRSRAPGGSLGAVPGPRSAPEDDTGRRRRVYADGSALTRYLPGAPCGEAWRAWAAEHEQDLVTTPLGLTQLRGTARTRGVDDAELAHEVGARVEVVRFSDQTLAVASRVAGALPTFAALHAGAAIAHPDVRTVATYDVQLARVVALYGLAVVAPGRPERWWQDEGVPG